MDEQRSEITEPQHDDEQAVDHREPYEPPALESLGGVYGQTQQTGP